MTGYLIDYRDKSFALPDFISWEISHTDGTCGSDSFEICFAYEKSMNGTLGDAVRFKCCHGGATVFFGIVDEYSVLTDKDGKRVTVSGRGLGGLLLDNRCHGQEYISCNIGDILKSYVYPLGITDVEQCSIPAITGYSVSTGDSCWSALYNYIMFASGGSPRFSPDGKLILSGREGNVWNCMSDVVTKKEITRRRYGVISKVDMMTADGLRRTVENTDFINRGGMAKKVITVPRKTGWDRMRYLGEDQIENSEKDCNTAEITVAELFPVFPGDRVILSTQETDEKSFWVAETVCYGSSAGYGTKIIMTWR